MTEEGPQLLREERDHLEALGRRKPRLVGRRLRIVEACDANDLPVHHPGKLAR